MNDRSETARYSDFFNHRPTAEIARAILGKRLVYRSPQGILSGYLVEVEAYLGQSGQPMLIKAGAQRLMKPCTVRRQRFTFLHCEAT